MLTPQNKENENKKMPDFRICFAVTRDKSSLAWGSSDDSIIRWFCSFEVFLDASDGSVTQEDGIVDHISRNLRCI